MAESLLVSRNFVSGICKFKNFRNLKQIVLKRTYVFTSLVLNCSSGSKILAPDIPAGNEFTRYVHRHRATTLLIYSVRF